MKEAHADIVKRAIDIAGTMSSESNNTHLNVPPQASPRSTVCTSVAVLAALAAFALAAYSMYRGEPEAIVAAMVGIGASRCVWQTIQPRSTAPGWLEPKEPSKQASHADGVAVLFLVASLLLLIMLGLIAWIAISGVLIKGSQLKPAAAVPFSLAMYMLASSMEWRVRARAIRHTSAAADCAPTSPQSR